MGCAVNDGYQQTDASATKPKSEIKNVHFLLLGFLSEVGSHTWSPAMADSRMRDRTVAQVLSISSRSRIDKQATNPESLFNI
jgi:hypothetical protein